MTTTKSPVAKRRPCTYAVPSPSFASRGRSCCARQASRLMAFGHHGSVSVLHMLDAIKSHAQPHGNVFMPVVCPPLQRTAWLGACHLRRWHRAWNLSRQASANEAASSDTAGSAL